ncbi:MAG TPA: hypothetical protein VKA24_14600 [Gaiellaceae bacterium]|nr:hypothetical protein [Gaiellaceae bacterium]
MTGPPLFAVSGATGVGKTTATARLPELVPEVLRLDGDLLWSNEYFDRPESITRFYATWLNVAAAIAENGVSLVFCGAVARVELGAASRARAGRRHSLPRACL